MEEEILNNGVVCEYEKRRKCDSAYIHLYNKLLKDYTKLKSELEDYKQLLKIYQEICDTYLKGGEEDERTRNDFIK